MSSAGDHEFREIQVKIWPSPGGARYAVSLRRRRGGDLVWDRRLCTSSVPAGAAAATATVAGAMRAVAATLVSAAERMDALS
jgi:hypothetical protein